jgi:hypothetical protein
MLDIQPTHNDARELQLQFFSVTTREVPPAPPAGGDSDPTDERLTYSDDEKGDKLSVQQRQPFWSERALGSLSISLKMLYDFGHLQQGRMTLRRTHQERAVKPDSCCIITKEQSAFRPLHLRTATKAGPAK